MLAEAHGFLPELEDVRPFLLVDRQERAVPESCNWEQVEGSTLSL